MENTNYNWMSAAGLADLDDMDIVNALGLDPELAYTPELNKAALQAAHKLSYQGYLEQGMDQKDARDLSNRDHQQVLDQIKNAEKMVGKTLL